MGDEKYIFDLLQEFKTFQNKITYFLLAAAGSAIALAVNRTEQRTMEFTMLPLGVAVLLWGLSFFCGFRQLVNEAHSMYANIEMMRIARSGLTKEQIVELLEEFKQVDTQKRKRADIFGKFQFQFLILGALMYIVWHILEMYVRSTQT